jgi:hypothetical protein
MCRQRESPRDERPARIWLRDTSVSVIGPSPEASWWATWSRCADPVMLPSPSRSIAVPIAEPLSSPLRADCSSTRGSIEGVNPGVVVRRATGWDPSVPGDVEAGWHEPAGPVRPRGRFAHQEAKAATWMECCRCTRRGEPRGQAPEAAAALQVAAHQEMRPVPYRLVHQRAISTPASPGSPVRPNRRVGWTIATWKRIRTPVAHIQSWRPDRRWRRDTNQSRRGTLVCR